MCDWIILPLKFFFFSLFDFDFISYYRKEIVNFNFLCLACLVFLILFLAKSCAEVPFIANKVIK